MKLVKPLALVTAAVLPLIALSSASASATRRSGTQLSAKCKVGFVVRHRRVHGKAMPVCVERPKPQPKPAPPSPVSLDFGCSPASVTTGQTTTCTATVDGQNSFPTGSVGMTTTAPGKWTTPITCDTTGATTFTCSARFQAGLGGGTPTFTANYIPGDSAHAANSTVFLLVISWYPAGFVIWSGGGNGNGVVAYQPSSCSTLGGSQVANGSQDSEGNICFSYLLVSDKDCLNDIYAEANVIQNGVVVGYTNDLEHVSAGQLVQMHSVVYGHAGATLQLTKVDCN